MASSEMFTLLAVVEARDRLTATWEKMTGTVDRFNSTIKKAADTAAAAGSAIDASLLQTASGADALELADARVQAALAEVTAAAKAQADAETELLAANRELAAGADDVAVAEARQSEALGALAAAEGRSAAAAKTLSDAQVARKGVTDAMAAADDTATKKNSNLGSTISSVAGTMGKAGLAVDAIGALSIKAAGNFQSASEHLVTDAGESQGAIDKVRSQMLQLSVQTGTTADELVNGMYHIESSGQHGAAAMQLLTVAAQGAKVGGADLDTTTKALMGTMTAYGFSANQTTGVMNALITTTSAGDLRMQDLAGSLSNVAPVAAAAGISLDQVGGAIATMTAQGFSADRATQDLANSIRSLQNPNNQAIAEMQQLGLNANDVASNLGKRGLTGTLAILTQALADHTKNGQVFIDTLKNSQAAAANLKTAMAQLPPELQKSAQALLDGKMTAAEWGKTIKDLPVGTKNLATQFEGMIKKADSFNQLLKSGKPEAQTFNAALSTLMGGATGLNTALMLSGTHTEYFNNAVQQVGASLNSKSKDVDNWAAIQGTFNQKMDRAKTSVEAMGISIGTGLIPIVEKVVDAMMKVIGPITAWISNHEELAGIVVASLGGFFTLVGAINLGVKAFGAIKNAIDAVNNVFGFLGRILGLTSKAQDKVTGGAETMAQRSTQASQATAAGWDEVAVSAEGAATATEEATVATEGATAAAEENAIAADAENTSWLRTGITMVGTAAKFLALKVAQLAGAAATGVATAATWAFNAAMAVATSPITLVVLAIAALVAAFIWLWDNCKPFRDFWKELWQDIKTIAVDVWHALDQAFHDGVQWIKDAWHAVQDATETAWHWVEGRIKSAVNTVENILNWFGSLPGKFANWLEQTAQTIKQKIEEAILFFANLQLKVLNLLKDAGTWLVHVGEDIIKGLAHGIDNMVGWLEDKVKSIGSSIVGGFKKVLSIFSPSQVMADEVGKFIPMGIGKGITDNLGAITSAIGAASRVTVNAGITSTSGIQVTGLGGSLPTLGVGSGAGGSSGPYIDFRGSTVMSDRDWDNIADKLGRALGTRVLPRGGYYSPM